MIRIVLVSLMTLACATPAPAQYPERPVTILSGYPAGGMVDIVARLLADGMRAQFLLIENIFIVSVADLSLMKALIALAYCDFDVLQLRDQVRLVVLQTRVRIFSSV